MREQPGFRIQGLTERTEMIYCMTMKQTETIIHRIIRVLERRIANITGTLHQAKTAARIRQKGELLKNAAEFRKGMERITLTDYYSDSLTQVTVETDPSLDRFENARCYFKKARKLETSVSFQKKRLDEAQQCLKRVQDIRHACAREELPAAEAREQLAAMGFGRFFPALNRPRSHKERNELLKTFTSTDGFTVYAGRNAEDNDYVTFHLGTGKDIWMHASGYAGSHVVIKVKKGEQVPRRTLKQAAALAVHYSKARGNYRTEVTYSYVHNVRRASRRQPGKVTVQNPEYIKPDKKALDDIMDA